AAAALADAAAQHQHVDDAPVVHVHVVPVVHGRADDHHGFAVGPVGVLGELTRHGDHMLAPDAGDALLPCGGIGHVVVVARGHVVAAEPPVETVVGAGEIEHGGHQRLGAVGQLQAAGGHVAHLDRVVVRVGEVLVAGPA